MNLFSDEAKLSRARPAVLVLGSIALFFFYYKVFGSKPQNADSASGLLRAIDVFHGNILLKGWEFPTDTFLTSDIPLNGLAYLFLGLHPTCMVFASSAIWTILVILALLATTWKLETKHQKWALATTFLLIGLPRLWGLSNIGGFSMTFIHVGAPCYMLLAYVFAAKCVDAESVKTYRYAFTSGFFLFLGCLGDPLCTVLVGVSILTCSLITLYMMRWRSRAGWSILISSALAIVATVIVNKTMHIMGFHPIHADTDFLDFNSVPRNLMLLVKYLFMFSGAFFFSLPIKKAALLEVSFTICRLPILAACIYCTIKKTQRLVTKLNHVDHTSETVSGAKFFDRILLVTLLVNIACVLTSHSVTDEGCSRYFLPGYVSGTLLVARSIHNYTIARYFLTPALLSSLLLYALQTGSGWFKPPQGLPQNHIELAQNLESAGLQDGYAQYWDAHVLMVASSGKLRVRTLSGGDQLGAYPYQSKFSMYAPTTYKASKVFVVSEKDNANSLNQAQIYATFGQPAETRTFGNYTLYLYAYSRELAEVFHAQALNRASQVEKL